VLLYFKQITATKSGMKPDALGKLYHDFPAASQQAAVGAEGERG
jgi:hypothetical protein